jgi:hypothetical protein
MLGLPAGPCAKAGKVIAGKLTAAKAALETSILLKLLLIFIASAPNFQIVMRERTDLFEVRRTAAENGARLPTAIAAAIRAPSMSTFLRWRYAHSAGQSSLFRFG